MLWCHEAGSSSSAGSVRSRDKIGHFAAAAAAVSRRCMTVACMTWLSLAQVHLNACCNVLLHDILCHLPATAAAAAAQALHDCGMTKLSLEANQLSGDMDDAWGDLVHLKVLNLGEWLLFGCLFCNAAAEAGAAAA
jgi:hypothetical protein